MAGTESKKALSLWPKVLLWGAVIVVGFLYLGSVDDRRSSGEQEDAVPSTSSAPEPAAPVEAPNSPDAAAKPLAADAEPVTGEAIPAQSPPPRAPIPSEVSTAAAIPVPPKALPLPSPPAQAQVQETADAAPAQDPEAESGSGALSAMESEGVEAVTDATADVTPAEAEAFAKAVISEPEDGEPISEPEVSAPPRPASPEPAPVSPPSLEERRAAIMAEYQAMRQRAQEQMRQRWMQGGGSVPPPPYGGYPGYPPAYYQPQQQR